MIVLEYKNLENAVLRAQEKGLPVSDIYIGALPNDVIRSTDDFHHGFGLIIDHDDKDTIETYSRIAGYIMDKKLGHDAIKPACDEKAVKKVEEYLDSLKNREKESERKKVTQNDYGEVSF